MKEREEVYEILKNKFSDSIFELLTEEPTEPVVPVDPLKIHEVCEFLRDEEGLKYDNLMLLSGVDDANGEEIEEEDGSKTIKGGTLSVWYHLESSVLKHKLTLKVSAPRENPEVESVEMIWRSADWHEREAYDMFGFKFLNHHDLKRILMPYDWEEGSHPLRKDYKNPEFYQGMKIPY
ncbi:MAG: NADH-quinone oxidoreductase subunit C [Bacteroidetes bacterium]|nr:NADH-quinone oxidoreductase subunit C [Bacteroidota bacterium]